MRFSASEEKDIINAKDTKTLMKKYFEKEYRFCENFWKSFEIHKNHPSESVEFISA